MANDSGKAFWSDWSKKTAAAFGWAAMLVPVSEVLEQVVDAWGTEQGNYWHHAVAVVVVAALRAVVGLVQGKVGDPDKASFTKAPVANDPDQDVSS